MGAVSSIDAGKVSITLNVVGLPSTVTVPSVALALPAVIVSPSAWLLIAADVCAAADPTSQADSHTALRDAWFDGVITSKLE